MSFFKAHPTLPGLPTELQAEIAYQMMPWKDQGGDLYIGHEQFPKGEALAALAATSKQLGDVVKDTIARRAEYNRIYLTLTGDNEPLAGSLPFLWLQHRRIQSITICINYASDEEMSAVEERPRIDRIRRSLARFVELLTLRRWESESVKIPSILVEFCGGEELLDEAIEGNPGWFYMLEPLFDLPAFEYAGVNPQLGTGDDSSWGGEEPSEYIEGLSRELEGWLETDVEERDWDELLRDVPLPWQYELAQLSEDEWWSGDDEEDDEV